MLFIKNILLESCANFSDFGLIISDEKLYFKDKVKMKYLSTALCKTYGKIL